jgi:clan AA aspartic protease (TIGR02281 family)
MGSHSWIVLALCMGASCLVAIARADELADARAALEKEGIRALSTGIALAKESDLTKELGKSAGLRKNVLQAEKDLKAAELQAAELQRALTELKQQHVRLSAQLMNINPNDITLNNKLVSAIRVVEGQYELSKDQKARLDEEVKSSRAKLGEAREAYIELALSARRLADEIEADYAAKAADPGVKTNLARLNQAAKKQFTLTASASFQANLRRLKQLEDTVLSESIELTDDGKTMRVGVVVNGKHQQEMVLDSGASLISLPPSIAAKFGLKPTEKDPRIALQLADGREIEGWLMKLSTVRVGKFTVENVECAVLGAEAASAEPLLGMSFLGHFKFEVDSAARKLTMVKVSGTDGAVSKKEK